MTLKGCVILIFVFSVRHYHRKWWWRRRTNENVSNNIWTLPSQISLWITCQIIWSCVFGIWKVSNVINWVIKKLSTILCSNRYRYVLQLPTYLWIIFIEYFFNFRTSSLGMNPSKYHYAAHFGQLIQGYEGHGCHNMYPMCPFSGEDVQQIARKIPIR